MGPDDPTDPVAEAIRRLHLSGWPVGDAAYHDGAGGLTRIVSGVDGENLIRAEGATAAEAWARAVGQARGLGMLDESDDPDGAGPGETGDSAVGR